MRAIVEGLLALSSLSASSLEQTVRHLADADLKVVPIMIASLLAVYIVLRPFSPSFRIKRMLFNLAEASDVRLSASSATWHVSRSVGLYQRERALLGDFHLKGAREKPFGLILSMLATVLIGRGFTSCYMTDETDPDRFIQCRSGDIFSDCGLAGSCVHSGTDQMRQQAPSCPTTVGSP